jgi:hypothetical protein
LKGIGCTIFPHPSAYRGKPQDQFGSRVIIIASFLEGVAWYAELQSAKSVVGILRRGATLADHHRFRRSDVVDITFFSFFRFCFYAFLVILFLG